MIIKTYFVIIASEIDRTRNKQFLCMDVDGPSEMHDFQLAKGSGGNQTRIGRFEAEVRGKCEFELGCPLVWIIGSQTPK